jgi:cysteine-rich repeat protein
MCGNGVLDPYEECDYCARAAGSFDLTCRLAATESKDCNHDCTLEKCGDGKTNHAAGEECDDAGESTLCNADCTIATCGDGKVNSSAGETCEVSSSGVDSSTCNGVAAGAVACQGAACGDGYVNVAAGETCDDMNFASGDGCSPSCQVEPGFTCPTTGRSCKRL